MEMKYKLTEESISYFGKTLYRIEALKDFGNVKKSDKGGYVQSEENLSQEGDCWICGDAKVFNIAYVYGNALVCDNAQVCGDAQVYGNAIIANNALVCGNAEVYDDAQVYGNAKVSGYTYIYGNAQVCDKAIVAYNAKVFGNAQVYGNVQVSGSTKIYDDAQVYGNAYVCDDTVVCDNALVFDNAVVYDNALVCGNAQVCGDAEIKNNSDYIIFKNWWSSGRYFTWTKSNNMWKVGCFYGTGEELIAKAYKDSELSGREYKRVVDYVESILQNNK